MIAPCGIDCKNCDMYKASQDREFAEFLAADWRQSGHPKADASWFTCQGCHGDESLVWCDDCDIRDCCKKDKKLHNCSECEIFPCSMLESSACNGFPNHKQGLERLKQLHDANTACAAK